MTVRGQVPGQRHESSEKIRTFIRDSENTMTYSPNDFSGNKFFGSWSKLLNLQNMLFYENKEKYLNEYQARFQAKLEIGSIPYCFGTCVSDVDTVGLSSDEKNCIRECYLKRVSARDDMNLLFQQRIALETIKGQRDHLV